MRSRFILFLIPCLAFFSWGIAVAAQCVQQPSSGVWNALPPPTGGYQTITYAAAGSDLLGKFWIYNLPATINSGTTTQATMLTGNGQASGVVFPYCTWVNGTSSPTHPSPWDTTNSVTCDRTVFLYSNYNNGSPQYLIMSVQGNSGKSFNFDLVTNGPGNVLAPFAMPQITSASRVATAGGADYTVNWTAIANPKGYYDSAPAGNIVTGVAVYYWNAAGTPTSITDYAITNLNWVLAAGGPSSRTGYVTFLTGADPGTTTVWLPDAAPNPSYCALELLFDGVDPSQAAGFCARTDFVGHAVSLANPTPAGVFAGFDAKLAMGTVTATWRSNAESGLAFYQVYASKLVGGPYVPINGTLTSPMGDSHVYTATFPFPKEIGKRKVFLKVKATDMDGTEWWTQPVKVARRTAP